MKRSLCVVLSILVVLLVFTGCTQAPTSPAATSTVGPTATPAPVTIKWFQFQIEVAEQIKNMAKNYQLEHPNVTIEAEIMGEGYYDILKTKAATNDMPDVFMTAGYNEIKTYKDFMTDLSGAPFVDKIVDAAKSAISLDGKVVGLPVQMSGYGIIYNKKIFSDNGLVVPTTFSELKAICETLKSKDITPFVNQFKDGWILGQILSYGVAANPDPLKFISDVGSGTVKVKDNEMMKKNLALVDLMVQYGLENPLDDDWNSANTKFAQGKAAMIGEGIWVYDTIKAVNPDIDMGLFACPMTDDASQTRIAADVNGVWHINKNSKSIDTVKEIFTWIVTSDAGKNFITKECKFIPAYKDVTGDLNSLCSDVNAYIVAGKTIIWAWPSLPDGAVNNFGKVYQDHIFNKVTNPDTTLEALNAEWLKGVK